MNMDGSGQVQLTPDGFYSDTDPSYSPDGTRIVFSSGRDNDLGLFVMNADGSAPARLTSGPDSDALPVWAAAPPSGGGGSVTPPVVVTQPPAVAPALPVVTVPAPKRFSIHSRKLRVKKGVTSLTLDVPGAGRARVSGTGLRTGDASARRAGKLTIALRLTSATPRHLRRAHTVKLRLDVRFTPVHAAASV
jgi:WD40-like Beta Propeller Repeat